MLLESDRQCRLSNDPLVRGELKLDAVPWVEAGSPPGNSRPVGHPTIRIGRRPKPRMTGKFLHGGAASRSHGISRRPRVTGAWEMRDPWPPSRELPLLRCAPEKPLDGGTPPWGSRGRAGTSAPVTQGAGADQPMKVPTMSNRPTEPYRILLSEVRVYAIEIHSETDYDLEDWAREGWEKSDPTVIDPELTLVHRRLVDVTVHEKSMLPWRKPVELLLTV